MKSMLAELERLKAENEKLKKGSVPLKGDALSNGLSAKVGDKKGLSIYGLGKFPVTLYKEQWQKLLEVAPEILDYIEKHDAELVSKETTE
jgi:hypothetical protein